jgi:hypothetical protein
MAAATKKKKRKEEACLWKAGASSGHITNLKKSILETFDIYDKDQSGSASYKVFTTNGQNGTARFQRCKQLFEYKHLLLLRDIWWSKLKSIFKCCSFF